MDGQILNLHTTLDYVISVPAGINTPGVTFGKINKHASWKIEKAFFVANDTFSNTKIAIFKRLINLPYEIRSMPAGKVSKY